MKIRYRWIDTDGGNDNELDIDEFLAFRHPEIASRTYKYIVDDIITQMGLSFFSSLYEILMMFILDQDNDLKIKEAEFIDLACMYD